MKTPMLLHIPEPCHENWDAMTPQDKGRHCQNCNKVVVDFSVMSDRQVLDYFKKTTGNTCGRFHTDQLQRPLLEPQKQPNKWSYFLASFIAFVMSAKTFAQQKVGKVKIVGKPSVERVLPKGDIIEVEKDTSKIKRTGDTLINKEIFVNVPYGGVKITTFIGSEAVINNSKIIGKIVDEKNNAIVGATIKLKGTKLGTSSNVNGKFELKSLGENNKLTLTISSIGFETKEIEIVPKDLKGELSIVLKESKEIMNDIVVQVTNCTIKSYLGGTAKMERYKKIRPTIKDTLIKKVQQIFNKESIKIHPNPAAKNAVIHISIKDAGEYALQMYDMQSKLMIARKIITNTSNETTAFQLPATAITGAYFIRIINEKTQKQVTEKIIVQ